MTAAGPRGPVGYTIRVAARLDERWADWFDGFTLTAEADGTTTFVGVVSDQAQLHGLLAKIRDIGVALIALEACGTGLVSPSPTATKPLRAQPGA